MRMPAALIILAVAGAALGGCSEPLGPLPGITQPGVLQLVEYDGAMSVDEGNETVRWSVAPDGDVLVPSPVVMAPDTVVAGQPFDVVVTTIGLSGCWRAADQQVRVRDGVVDLTPTDMHSGARACTEILLYLAHPSTLTLDEPGEWILRVSGRRMRQGDDTWEEPVAVEKAIVVR